MVSTNYTDFSVRKNKTIERSIVFEGLKRITDQMNRSDLVYVGFGSVWFADFDMAHREIGINTMISIEAEEITYKRACFNRPFRTVEVLQGGSHDVIPELIAERADLQERPWIVWLDYDNVLDETKLDELTTLVETLPDNSVLLTTFSASGSRYVGKPLELRARFEELFGDAFPWEEFGSNRSFRNEGKLMVALSQTVMSLLESHFLKIGRCGRFIPAFELQYQDGTPMATTGGVLAAIDTFELIQSVVSADDWSGISTTPIVVPPLTQREVAALRSLLPNDAGITRQEVRTLGFDLLDQQVDSFTEHYLRYPTFVQAVR